MKCLIGFILLMLAGISLQACQEKPLVYHRDEAIRVAQVKLSEYVQQEGLRLEEFKGPFTKPEAETSRETAYFVCYLSPKHYFCYYQFTGNTNGALKTETDPEIATTRWLQNLDPYGADWFTPKTP